MQLKMSLQNARVFVQRQTKPFQMLVFSPVATRSVTSSFQSSCSSIQITTLTLLKQYLQLCEDTANNANNAINPNNDNAKDVSTLFTELIAYATQSDQYTPHQQCRDNCYTTHSIATSDENPAPFPEPGCVQKADSPCAKCYNNCSPKEFQCGFGCAIKHFQTHNYIHNYFTYQAELVNCYSGRADCYKCVSECARTSATETTTKATTATTTAGATGTSAVTSFTILFSVAIASLMM